ncbi:N6-Methyl-AMP deaminase-like isoform X2 [Porites lutea]|uniref:N6-Methyl-AMP deaminase-like isoform X2 n=1 Tax=Porites lutea TaxID=51062 RepID=UPI003CC69E86
MAETDSGKTAEERIPFNYFKKIPKIELHAHINGSISSETIKKLIQRKSTKEKGQNNVVSQWETTILKGDEKNLDECFKMWDFIYPLVDDTEAVFLVTKSVIEDFAQDNVRYLELRSTPRANPKTGMTKESYIEAVLAAIEEAKTTVPDITVRFIAAINRKYGPADALHTVQLASAIKAKGNGTLVGIDLSGDPKVPDIDETRVLLSLIPDRIGHGTCIHPENGGADDLVNIVEKHLIPIELCLTSNVKTKTVPSYTEHHMDYWYNGKKHPCIVCTDDKGVFSITLSEEYSIMAKTFNLTEEEVWDLTLNSIDYIFENDSVKNTLKETWKAEKQKIMSVNK